MVLVKPDARRRITLTKEVSEMADEFELLKLPGEIVLIPIPKDPLRTLEEQGKKIPSHLTIKEIKEAARRRAVKDAKEGMKRVLRRQ